VSYPTKHSKLAAVREFLEWVGEYRGLHLARAACLAVLDEYAETVLTECDTAVAAGPGHQSIHPCIVTPSPHREHASDNGYEWLDEDLSEQTYDKHQYRHIDGRIVKGEVLKTYRLTYARELF